MSVLDKIEPTLPSAWYYDADHFRRELEAIWYREWVCVGRLEQVTRPGDYFVAGIGTQRVIVTRDRDDRLRAFHNTCRHRGSTLCTEESGHFANGRIVCPYHTWTYSLDGELLATPFRVDSRGFAALDYPLYPVCATAWGGFIFVNLADEPAQTLAEFLGCEAEELAHWPLAELRSVQQERTRLACNWKLFWENYNECYHCPRIHPELCRVVPVYKEGIMSPKERPDWRASDAPEDDWARVGAGVETWTVDGRSDLPPLAGPDDADRAAGMRFSTFLPSLFVVGHPDYVRSVRVVPCGPESTDLVVDWYLPPDVAGEHADKIEHMLELGRIVVAQDGRVCELNQQGLRSRAHRQGVLVAQEYYLWDFHQWLRRRLCEPQTAEG
ncbi:MAG: aromatic ring-hydroxylating dioxygenase subunit alpha [Gammaproteobacteria bacterium]|nr:aromatic ring-hydroxylating dioxygenase subunit alpha [Gammaproteobacteria bacterium]MDH4255241.1 aromatic ring-hydroxylating dioxygenase subunit alpha [Gammaproteobacteria bacterium]MDH5310052.1 aromatic ring-hydroxylating dioxygenase subunit alpha [Gammaproteobacteria bacterium]